MAIDRLNSASSLISAIRAEITRKSERGRANAGAARAQGAERGRDPAALRKELAEMVRSVPADDPEALKSVRPRLLKAVLLWEFGSRLREHSQWQPMLENVVAAFEKDDPEQRKLSELVRELQR